MVKLIRIYRQSRVYSAVGHPDVECRLYCDLDSLVSDIIFLGISPLDIDFSDIDKTFLNYERNEN